MVIEMTDKDSVWSFYEALGCVGNMSGKRTRKDKPKNKPTYKWKTGARHLIFDIVMHFYPYLHERRRETCQQFLAWYLLK